MIANGYKVKDHDKVLAFVGDLVMYGLMVRYNQPRDECRGPVEQIEIRVPKHVRQEYPEPDRTDFSADLSDLPEGFKIATFGTTNDGMGFVVYERPIDIAASQHLEVV